MRKSTALTIPNYEWERIIELVPALTLDELVPKLQREGYRVMIYRNSGCKNPYQLGVYSMALDVQNDEEKIKGIAGKRFDVQGIKNAEEIIIKLK